MGFPAQEVSASCLATERREIFGAIAQLGERLHGMQEVRSSTLLGSTSFNALVAQLVERVPCKYDVASSNLAEGSKPRWRNR
jgi:hypothetical protein